MRKSPCKWLSRDETGRPSCMHGPAHKDGSSWCCSLSDRQRTPEFLEAHRERMRVRRGSSIAPGTRALTPAEIASIAATEKNIQHNERKLACLRKA